MLRLTFLVIGLIINYRKNVTRNLLVFKVLKLPSLTSLSPFGRTTLHIVITGKQQRPMERQATLVVRIPLIIILMDRSKLANGMTRIHTPKETLRVTRRVLLRLRGIGKWDNMQADSFILWTSSNRLIAPLKKQLLRIVCYVKYYVLLVTFT